MRFRSNSRSTSRCAIRTRPPMRDAGRVPLRIRLRTVVTETPSCPATWRALAAVIGGGWLAVSYLAVFGSIVAFSSYMYLLKHVRPAAATSYAYVNPVVAVLLGIAFAGERIGAEECLAMGVIVGAVVLIGLPQWRRAPRQVA